MLKSNDKIDFEGRSSSECESDSEYIEKSKWK